jgi:SAM-dependent methyltransferase
MLKRAPRRRLKSSYVFHSFSNSRIGCAIISDAVFSSMSANPAVSNSVASATKLTQKRAWSFLNSIPGQVGRKNEAGRVAWIEKTLTELPRGLRLLDAGCGEQPFRSSCLHLDYVAQDFAKYDGKGDGAGFQTGTWDHSSQPLDLVCEITSIPEPDASFDAILCTEVLEHVPDPVKVLREFSRLLKPKGTLILTAPFCSLAHFTPYHFSTGFNRYWYEANLADLGFSIAEMSPNGNFYDYLAQELRRLPSITKRFCPQPAFPLYLVVHFLIVFPLLAVLNLLAKCESRSSDVVCFGYHVVAQRNRPE